MDIAEIIYIFKYNKHKKLMLEKTQTEVNQFFCMT